MSWMRMLFAAAALALFPMHAVAASSDEAPTLKQDAAILAAALRQLYPSYDRYGQGEAVDAALARLAEVARADPDPLTFYRAVTDVAAVTRDEHVIPFPNSAYRSSRREGRMMLPYTVRWVDEVPYVVAVADSAQGDLIGKQVVRFDDRPAAEVLATLRATIPSDGLSETFAIRHLQDFTPTQNENYFDLNYPIWFGERGAYSLSVEGPDGEAIETVLEALDWESFMRFYRERLPRTPPVEFEWLDERTAHLTIRSFHDRYYEQHEVSPAARFEAILAELNARRDARLLLDLRENEGGGDISSLLLDHLLQRPFLEYDAVITQFVGQPEAALFCDNAAEVRFDPNWAIARKDGRFALKPEFLHLITGGLERAPRDDAFAGEIVVLISGATGSAAVKVASVLAREGRARFVGEETGGAAAGATAFGNCALTLPASGIRIDLPIVRFEREQSVPYGRGILPEVTVDAGLTPPLAERDEALEAARKLSASQGVSKDDWSRANPSLRVLRGGAILADAGQGRDQQRSGQGNLRDCAQPGPQGQAGLSGRAQARASLSPDP
ncbi:MAG: S41 family peptidase [Pseudomonadota bacterium]